MTAIEVRDYRLSYTEEGAEILTGCNLRVD